MVRTEFRSACGRRRPALTLLEVLLVIALIVVVGAVAYPTLSAMYGDVKVKAAADRVQAAWTEARTRAIEDGRAYRFAVQPGTGRFRVAPDLAEFWDGSDGAALDPGDHPPLIQEGELTRPIVFEVPADLPSDGRWTAIAIFNPDGTCQADIEVTLKDDDDSTPVVVRVRAMTGAITVRKKSENR